MVIGLTGGIASGKTVVARVLEELGAFVIDADEVYRELTSPGSPLCQKIAAIFGPEYLLSDGNLDRAKLAGLVFRSPHARRRLEDITHPPILERIAERISASEAEVIVLVAPLLLEAGQASMVEEIWVVGSSPQVQIRRIMERDGLSKPEAEARLASQLSLEEKIKYAHVIIDNNGSLAETAVQVRRAWEDLLQRQQNRGIA